MKKITLVIALCLSICSAQASVIYGIVTKVSDGDTIWVRADGGQKIKVRLFAIDAPEKDQSHGQYCQRNLQSYIYKQSVKVVTNGNDQYGRVVGTVVLGGGNVNLQQIMDGCAWVYGQYAKELPDDILDVYYEAENQARENKKGLWENNDAIAPWRWRKGQRQPSKEDGVVVKAIKELQNYLF